MDHQHIINVLREFFLALPNVNVNEALRALSQFSSDLAAQTYIYWRVNVYTCVITKATGQSEVVCTSFESQADVDRHREIVYADTKMIRGMTFNVEPVSNEEYQRRGGVGVHGARRAAAA